METNSPNENAGITSGPRGSAGRILITGANGQLGMELRDLSSYFPEYDFIFLSRQELAVEDAGAVKAWFDKNQPQYCINCAAYTAVDKAESEREEAFRGNADAAGIIAAACKTHNTILFYISTDYVFNGAATVPYKENAPVDPVNVYGASKLDGERQSVKNNPATIIIRTSWVYSVHGKNFVKTMLKLMREKEEISVVNDQFGSPTYAADLAGTILQIVADLPWRDSRIWMRTGVYHYSNDGVVTWYDLASAIKELSGSQCTLNPISTSQFPTPARRPSYSVLDKTKIQQTFGIGLKDWKESLTICVGKLLAVSR